MLRLASADRWSRGPGDTPAPRSSPNDVSPLPNAHALTPSSRARRHAARRDLWRLRSVLRREDPNRRNVHECDIEIVHEHGASLRARARYVHGSRRAEARADAEEPSGGEPIGDG